MKRAAITYCFILMLCGLNFTTAQTNDSLPASSTDPFYIFRWTVVAP